MPEVSFQISAEAQGPTTLLAKARQFEITVDEPAKLGGQDTGANPVEYLLSCLCGCINVVLHMVAREQGIKLNKVAFKAVGTLDPMKFIGRSDDNRAGFQQINIELDIDADADDQQIKQLLEAAEQRCPVSDNIQNPTPVNIQLAD